MHEGRVGILTDSTFLRTAFSPDVMRGRWVATFLERPDFPLADEVQSELEDVLVAASYLDSPRYADLVREFLQRWARSLFVS